MNAPRRQSFPVCLKSLILLTLVVAAHFTGPASAAPPATATARMVYYSGTVQGVGFRATAVEIARDHPVTGWVRNLPDSRVQLLAEGSEEAVEKFLKVVRARWKDNIKKEQIEKQEASGKLKGFTILK
jgi:acylphosphatase